VLHLADENISLRRRERMQIIFMAHVVQSLIAPEQIGLILPSRKRSLFCKIVLPLLHGSSKPQRKRATAIAFHLMGIHTDTIADFMGYEHRTIRRLVKKFQNKQYELAFATHPRKPKKHLRKEIRDKVFSIMHMPPSQFGINRTTWTIDLLRDVLEEEGLLVGKNTISKIIKLEGYNFRKTREVLTSNDPTYREKLKRITRILRRLGPADRFFSIDEYGPFSVKERGGRRRVRKGEYPTIPQYQRSKGCIIVTCALELGSNQITHFYSDKKDTEEMIKLLHVLVDQYAGCRRLYFSWDSASWHSSRKFRAEVRRLNHSDYRNSHQTPTVKLAPLPARAQFLNVIESVFAGMSQAIIHNSNYASVEDAKAAIDKYFLKRNLHFQRHPRRAGNKIWGDELVASKFSPANNCKHPKFMSLASIR
jgi:transposase